MFGFKSRVLRNGTYLGLVFAVTLIASLGVTQPISGLAKASTVTTNVFYQESGTLTAAANPVIVACAGEELDFTLNGHLVSHVTETDNGYHAVFKVNEQVALVGVDSGRRWRGVFVLNEQESAIDRLPFETQFMRLLKVVPQGPGPGFTRQRLIHLTIDANGNVTADVDKLQLSCG